MPISIMHMYGKSSKGKMDPKKKMDPMKKKKGVKKTPMKKK